MSTPLRALLAALLVPSLVQAQTLRHVRVDTPRAQALAAELAAEGFDVVEGSVSARGLEVIGSEAWVQRLAERGLEPRLIAVGRPYADIQREAFAAAPEMPPAGYSDLAGILARMNAAAAAHPGLAQVVDLNALLGLPLTHGGRAIHALKISDNVTQDEDEPNVLVVSDHHAREIVTPEIALTAADRLLNGYGSDPAITSIVDGNEIWIVPVWNPDGYHHVFAVDNFWRKNRRNNGNGTWGVDLNRNYPFGWSTSCSGSSNTSSETYKGPAAGSEPETQLMIAFSNARRFEKVLDYHSFGREVLWAYAACLFHPFGTSFLKPEAVALSVASGYGGSERPPSADGEHYEWQLARFANMAFLIETHTSFQPSHASALSEASLLWPGVLHTLQRPMPLWGRVTDAGTGLPLAAAVRFTNVNWANGETNSSGGPYGRWFGFLPPGSHQVEVSAPCYQTQTIPVSLSPGGSLQLDVALSAALPPLVYCTPKTNSQGCAPQIGAAGTPSASAGSGFTVSASGLIPGQLGTFFYGQSGAAAAPFQGGTLCVGTPVLRTPVQPSGGAGTCGGSYAFDFNAWVPSDPALIAGATVWGQHWSRDPADPFGTGLTDALQFTLCP